MMPAKQLDELEALHAKGVGIREIIMHAYQSGQAAELRASASAITRSVMASGPMGELVTTVAERDIMTRGLTEHQERQGGCFREEHEDA